MYIYQLYAIEIISLLWLLTIYKECLHFIIEVFLKMQCHFFEIDRSFADSSKVFADILQVSSYRIVSYHILDRTQLHNLSSPDPKISSILSNFNPENSH